VVAALIVAAIVVVIVLTTGGSSSSSAASNSNKPTTVSIGVADAASPYWKTFSTLAKKQLNVTIKLVNFNDYSQPNPALSQGQLDLNEFQHIQYLANYNVTSHDTLQPVGSTAIYPLPLYATKYAKVSQIPAGAKIAVDNDATNEGRSLLVLQAAGLITLKSSSGAFSSTSDILTHKVDVVTLDASQTATALLNGSVAAAVVNLNYATLAKLPASDEIYQVSPNSASALPYVNIFVARKADAGNPLWQKLVALYHTPAVLKGVQTANDGEAVFENISAAKLQAELAKVEAEAKAAGIS
jgi:D-methionine transport system substrate-binding protein